MDNLPPAPIQNDFGIIFSDDELQFWANSPNILAELGQPIAGVDGEGQTILEPNASVQPEVNICLVESNPPNNVQIIRESSIGVHNIGYSSVGVHNIGESSVGVHNIGDSRDIVHHFGQSSVGVHNIDQSGGVIYSIVQSSVDPHIGESSVGVHNIDQSSVGVHNIDQSSVGVHNIDQSSVGMHNIGQSSVGIHNIGQSSDGVYNIGQSSVGMHNIGQSSDGVHNIGQSSVGIHNIGQSSDGVYNIGQSSDGVHNIGQSGVGMHNIGQSSDGVHNIGESSGVVHNIGESSDGRVNLHDIDIDFLSRLFGLKPSNNEGSSLANRIFGNPPIGTSWLRQPEPPCDDSCKVLRDIVHGCANYRIHMSLHGEVGKFDHARVQVNFSDSENPEEVVVGSLAHFDWPSLKAFLEDYGRGRSRERLALLSDTLSPLYEALSVSLTEGIATESLPEGVESSTAQAPATQGLNQEQGPPGNHLFLDEKKA